MSSLTYVNADTIVCDLYFASFFENVDADFGCLCIQTVCVKRRQMALKQQKWLKLD